MSYLYRFYSNPEYAFDVLKNKRIALVRPKLFNDPFDPPFDFLYPSRATFLDYVKGRDVVLYEQMCHLFHNDESWDGWSENSRNYFQDILRELFICSFSFGETEKFVQQNHYMWAHYANAYNGLCIQFDLNLMEDSFRKDGNDGFFRMNYSDANLAIDCEHIFDWIRNYYSQNSDGNSLLNNRISEIIKQKAKSWELENEWRIKVVSDETSDVVYESIPDSALTGIYFGCRFNDKNAGYRDGIINAARENFPNAKIYDSKPVRGEFKLEFREI
jgi:hypothetical protein